MDFQKRKRIRLQDYDYSSAGVYFVTVCVKDRKRLLGEIVGEGDSPHRGNVPKGQKGLGKAVPLCPPDNIPENVHYLCVSNANDLQVVGTIINRPPCEAPTRLQIKASP